MSCKYHLFRITTVVLLLSTTLPASDRRLFPYRLNLKTDAFLAATLAGVAIPGHLMRQAQPQPDAGDILSLQEDKVNRIDRIALDRYDKSAIGLSNLPRDLSCYSPFILAIPLILQEQWTSTLTLTVMYLEAIQINKSLTSCVKSLTRRPRPYMYGSQLTLDEKLDRGRGGFRSFYSGHSSDAFCSAVSVKCE